MYSQWDEAAQREPEIYTRTFSQRSHNVPPFRTLKLQDHNNLDLLSIHVRVKNLNRSADMRQKASSLKNIREIWSQIMKINDTFG